MYTLTGKYVYIYFLYILYHYSICILTDHAMFVDMG
jgi:hypothetical protein